MASSENVEMFSSVTGATDEVARRHLQASNGDVQQAILMYFEAGGGDDSAAPAPAPSASPPAAASSAEDRQSSIESIMGLAKEGSERQDAGKGSGKKGSGKNGKDGDDATLTVGIVFFADGFMVDENPEEWAEEEAEEEAPKAVTRRIGMMSLDDLPRDPRGGRPKLPKKVPKLAPLRSYDTAESKQFLADVKAGKVPKELQRRDDRGRPMYTSISLSDERPRTYEETSKAIEQIKKMKEEEEAEKAEIKKSAPSAPALFTGSGQTLSSSGPASTSAPGGAASGACDPKLLALVRGRADPVVDDSKPATTLQLRLSTGVRVKARLNLDHTVADLWSLVAKELGPAAFAAASGQELSAGFPPKPLSDNSVTLAAADLANASVTHRSR